MRLIHAHAQRILLRQPRKRPQVRVRSRPRGHIALGARTKSCTSFLTCALCSIRLAFALCLGSFFEVGHPRIKAMKRKPERSETRTQGGRRKKPVRLRTSSAKTKPGRSDSPLEKVLSLITARPGIRPSEINQILNLKQSDALRATLIRRGVVRKEKDGSAMRYYLA
jgi:hypothetical protein